MCDADAVIDRLRELAEEARELIESADLAVEDLVDSLFGRPWRFRWGSLEEMAREILRRLLDGITPDDPDPLDHVLT